MLRFTSFFLVAVLGLVAGASVCAGSFVNSLSAEQKERMGLDRMTPQQLSELDEAVLKFRASGESIAAANAVEEYKKKEEPGVISRALDVFKTKQAEERQERVTAVVVGEFKGWEGRTTFTLDNGQVWRQSRPDVYVTRAKKDVPVVVYKAPSGYWRLRVLDDEGAWVTVTRVK